MSQASDNEAFVREFQRRAGIGVDGWAGRKEAWPALDRILPAPAAVKRALKDPAAFFASVRESFGSLKDPKQVEGFNVLLDAMAGWPITWVAYGLATAWHETNKTMQPVAEAYYLGAGAEVWRKANLRYWPWYGRGYPQTTWEVNYKRADEALGLGGKLLKNPDLMLTAEVAAPTMVRGMEEGWFTTRKLADFAPRDYRGMRKIINGTDKDDLIADHAVKFEVALNAGVWS